MMKALLSQNLYHQLQFQEHLNDQNQPDNGDDAIHEFPRKNVVKAESGNLYGLVKLIGRGTFGAVWTA